jgi:hypothetical protein
MPESSMPGDEQVLADRLRREAAADRPEFSESLHQQICHVVRHCDETKPSADLVPASGWPTRHAMVTAIAAAALLAATLVIWQAATNDTTPHRAEAPSPSGSIEELGSTPQGQYATIDAPTEMEMVGALTDLATEQIGILIESTVTQRHWNYLDENASLAFEALNNRVPLDAVASLVFPNEPAEFTE